MNSTKPRFGYCYGTDNEPVIVRAKKLPGDWQQAVAVIPLPFISTKIRREVAAFVSRINTP